MIIYLDLNREHAFPYGYSAYRRLLPNHSKNPDALRSNATHKAIQKDKLSMTKLAFWHSIWTQKSTEIEFYLLYTRFERNTQIENGSQIAYDTNDRTIIVFTLADSGSLQSSLNQFKFSDCKNEPKKGSAHLSLDNEANVYNNEIVLPTLTTHTQYDLTLNVFVRFSSFQQCVTHRPLDYESKQHI